MHLLRKVNVRISGDRIVNVGDFKPKKDEPVIDAKGLVLAPGFIDIHNHSTQGLDKDPLAETQIGQGITTVILGADGIRLGRSQHGWICAARTRSR